MAPTPMLLTPTTLAKEKTIGEVYMVDKRDRAKVSHDDFSDDIPVISLTGINDVEGRRSEIVREITMACEEWGIFQIVDHGVDINLISKMTKLTNEFFALPDEEKAKFQMSPGKKGGFIVSSHLQDEVVANWRELVVFFARPVEARDYSRWPDKPDEWRSVCEAYSERIMSLSFNLLELISEGLGLDKDALTSSLGEAAQHLVVNHYPKCPQPDLAVGLKRHTDPSSITILLQDHVGGLQATKDDGKTWITVRPIANAYVVNLGDHVYHMTNGRLKSADHQAIVNSDETRMSIAVFTNPEHEAKVYPLTLEDGEKSLLDKPITYFELYKRHNAKYLETIRLKQLAEEENWSQDELDLKLKELN